MNESSEPLTVSIEDGMVLLDGQGVAATLTGAAAKATAEELLAAAVEVLAAAAAGEPKSR